MHNTEPAFKWPVAAEQSIAASAEDVWTAISTPGNLESCHPFCGHNPVQVWDAAKSRDEVHYLSGWVYERRFRQWYEGVGYDLDIFRGDERVASVSWRITEVDATSCNLRITVYPTVFQNWPLIFRWFPYWLRIGPFLRSYLRSVVMGFEWYVTRGEAVPRDHFGKHPWFSARMQ